MNILKLIRGWIKKPLHVFLLFVLLLVFIFNYRFPIRNPNMLSVELETHFGEEEEVQEVTSKPDKLLPLTQDPENEIHITHIISTFSTMPSSEAKIIQQSWYEAIRLARKQGINVEVLDFTLPNDDKGSPFFAKRYDLSWWLHDVRKGKVATVGEPFNIAQKIGKGNIFVATNADIGFLPETYIKIWNWANKDYFSEEIQFQAMKVAADYLILCLSSARPENIPIICAEDAKIIYMHNGGFFQLWDEIAFDVAIMALTKKPLKTKLLQADKLRSILSVFSLQKTEEILGSSKLIDLKTYLPKPLKRNEIIEKVPQPHYFAGTITRLDFVSDPLPTNLSTILTQLRKRGQKHPGNDCFVFDPRFIPEGIRLMGHPAGVRPFGYWIATSFVDQGINFRRITGTIDNPWTFHVGKGEWGLQTIPWMERATQDPLYALFLAGNFDRLSSGAFRRMFEGSPSCHNSTRPWRMIHYCNSISNEYCIGAIRYGCAYKSTILLRDNLWYHDACLELHKQQNGEIKNPVCNICNFFFHLKQTSSQFVCKQGKMKYCEGLGEELC